MQRNPPRAMPGCTTTTNGDPILGGGIIRGTAQFYDVTEHLKASINFLPQDFGRNPDWKDCKPTIYVSVKGIDLDQHDAFMDENKRPGSSNPVRSKHPVMKVELGKDQA